MDVILITKNGDTSGRNLYNKLTESSAEVERIYIDAITPDARKKLLKAIIIRHYGDLEDLLTRNIAQYHDIDEIRDLKLSEFIDLIADNPRMLRTPIILNQYNEVIVGSNRYYTINDYVGRSLA